MIRAIFEQLFLHMIRAIFEQRDHTWNEYSRPVMNFPCLGDEILSILNM